MDNYCSCWLEDGGKEWSCVLWQEQRGAKDFSRKSELGDLGDLGHRGSDMSQDERCLCNNNAFEHLSFCRITMW